MPEKEWNAAGSTAEPCPCLTDAVDMLLGSFPQLGEGERITFASLGETAGLAWFPAEGKAVETEKNSVNGKSTAECRFPFQVVFRVTPQEEERRKAKNFLDDLGSWLWQRNKAEYPALDGGKSITKIVPESWGYLKKTEENGSENWVLPMYLGYQWNRE